MLRFFFVIKMIFFVPLGRLRRFLTEESCDKRDFCLLIIVSR